jgi:DNA-binding winged helix-turn-helix (wHTH) protein/tetratricopeptide (TPR) repeat protein
MASGKDRNEALARQSRFWIEDMHVQPDRLVFVRDNQEFSLKKRTMEALVCLAEYHGTTVSTEELKKMVWQTEHYETGSVHTCINRLRKDIDIDGQKSYIETIIGIGYRLNARVSFPSGYQPRPKRDEPWKQNQGSPYVGLESYDEAHAEVFHGRRTLTAELLEAMRHQLEEGRRFVLIDGPSGCGKSSVLRAGAIPKLRANNGVEGMQSLAVAICNLATMSEGDAIGALATSLTSLRLDDREVFSLKPSGAFRALLADRPEDIEGFIKEAFRKHRDRKKAERHLAHILLVIDHAEALVPSENADAAMLNRFMRILKALCGSQHMLVAMVCRRDAYPRLIDGMPELKELKAGKGHVEVFPPRSSEIRDIILRPAAQAGLRFEAKEGRLDLKKDNSAPQDDTATPDVTQSAGQLDNVIYEAATRQPDALPLLQHTLQSLYERRDKTGMMTFAAYNEIGGLAGAIGRRADTVFNSLPQASRDSIDSVFRKIIVGSMEGGIFTPRQGYLNSLSTPARDLVQAFIRARLFVAGLHKDGSPSFGVAHEALLRQWEKAREWIEDNQRLLQAKARVEQAANHWEKEGHKDDHLLNSGRPLEEAIEVENSMMEALDDNVSKYISMSKRRKVRLKRIRVATMIVLAASSVISIIAAKDSISSRNKAIASRNEAYQQREKSSDLSNFTVGELAEKLDASADLEVLESIGTKVLEYCKEINLSEVSADDLTTCSRAAIIVGEVRMEQHRNAEARSLFLLAIDFSSRAERKDPENSGAILQAGRAYAWLGRIENGTDEYKKAIDHWNKQLEYTRKLISFGSENHVFLMEHSFALSNIGTGLQNLGEFIAAKKHFSDAIRYGSLATNEKQQNHKWEYEIIVTKGKLAEMEAAAGDLMVADRMYIDAIRELNALNTGKNRIEDQERQLANFHFFHARVLLNKGDIKSARSTLKICTEIFSNISKKEPENRRWKRFLAQALILSSDVDRQENLGDEGYIKLMEADRLVENNPKSPPNIRRIKAEILFRKGLLTATRGGEPLMSEAISKFEIILKEKENRHARLSLAESHLLRATWLKSMKRTKESDRNADRALEILGFFPNEYSDTTVTAYRNMAFAMKEINNFQPKSKSEFFFDLSKRSYRRPDYIRIVERCHRIRTLSCRFQSR